MVTISRDTWKQGVTRDWELPEIQAESMLASLTGVSHRKIIHLQSANLTLAGARKILALYFSFNFRKYALKITDCFINVFNNNLICLLKAN